MKVLIVILVVAALAGVTFGAYSVIQGPAVQEGARGAGTVELPGNEMLALKGDVEILRQKYEKELEELIGQQAKKIDQLQRQVHAIGGSEPSAAHLSGGLDREGLKQLVAELTEELKRDERHGQFTRMQRDQMKQREKYLDKVARKFNWDEQKKEQVLEVFRQEMSQVEDVYSSYKGQEMTPEVRREISEKTREINQKMGETLKAMLSEEEYKGIGRARRTRRERGPSPRSDRFRPGRRTPGPTPRGGEK